MRTYLFTDTTNRIVLNGKTRLNVPINFVIMLKAHVNYTTFVLNDGSEKVVAHTLKYFEPFLKTYGFQRIHRATMINPIFIKQFDDNANLVTMKNDISVKISRRRRGAFSYATHNKS